jgi:hypothetical protein
MVIFHSYVNVYQRYLISITMNVGYIMIYLIYLIKRSIKSSPKRLPQKTAPLSAGPSCRPSWHSHAKVQMGACRTTSAFSWPFVERFTRKDGRSKFNLGDHQLLVGKVNHSRYGKPTKKIEKCFSRKGFCCFAGAREANSLKCGKKMDRHQMVYAALNSTSKPNVCHVPWSQEGKNGWWSSIS